MCPPEEQLEVYDLMTLKEMLRNPSLPVALYPKRKRLKYAALLLQALLAVPQVQAIVARTTSGEQ